MYIIKLDHKTEQSPLFPSSVTENLSFLKSKTQQNQMILKKNSIVSERIPQTEQENHSSEQRKYSDSFRKMMNKVLLRINRRNSFLKNNSKDKPITMSSAPFIKDEPQKSGKSLDFSNQRDKNYQETNKLKITGIGRTQNESNLLQRQNKTNPFIKTSISFTKNKEFKKSIQCRRTKSFSSDNCSDNSVQNVKQNSFILNNTRYCPDEFRRAMIEKSFKVGSFIPKITAKQNYKQVQQLLKSNIESKKSKIDIGKKLFHKKMVERQKNLQKMNDQFNKQTMQFTTKSKDLFEPWTTNDQFNEETFKISRKQKF